MARSKRPHWIVKMNARDPDAVTFLAAFRYNPFTGILTRVDGTPFVTSWCYGYRTVWYDGRSTFQHRIAYLLMMGSWPENDIDHINQNKAHNGWHNLRDATRQLNCFNRPLHKNNQLRVIGVSQAANGLYEPRIMKSYRVYYLGKYKTLEEAIAVRAAAVKALHRAE